MIPELKDKDYIDRLKALKLPSMHYRRDLVEMSLSATSSQTGFTNLRHHLR